MYLLYPCIVIDETIACLRGVYKSRVALLSDFLVTFCKRSKNNHEYHTYMNKTKSVLYVNIFAI